MIEIVSHRLDTAAYYRMLDDTSCGGLAIFEGRVRTHNEGREVASLAYECYPAMALRQMGALRDLAQKRWSLGRAVMAHRVGPIPMGEAAVWIGVASAHR